MHRRSGAWLYHSNYREGVSVLQPWVSGSGSCIAGNHKSLDVLLAKVITDIQSETPYLVLRPSSIWTVREVAKVDSRFRRKASSNRIKNRQSSNP